MSAETERYNQRAFEELFHFQCLIEKASALGAEQSIVILQEKINKLKLKLGVV